LQLALTLWLEVAIVDHTGIDIVAYNPSTQRRLGITVKSRTRTLGREDSSVNIFSYQKGKDDRQKVIAACRSFASEPWLAIYVEATDHADIYLRSLENYDAKYRHEGRAIDDWEMGPKYKEKYRMDPLVKHIKVSFVQTNWSW